jgi:hypothetical protein
LVDLGDVFLSFREKQREVINTKVNRTTKSGNNMLKPSPLGEGRVR